MSLGMEFARRRLKNISVDYKYVWGVYNLAYDKDESTAVEVSFNIAPSSYRPSSTEYTASSSGFQLVNASTSQTAADVSVGDYLVSVSYGNNTDTNGEYLYQVTSKRSTNTPSGPAYSFKCTKWSVGIVKGDTELTRVKSNSLDYPVNGEQNGYWYTMLKGEYDVYVWNLFEAAYTATEYSTNKYSTCSTTNNSRYKYASHSYKVTANEFQLVKPSKVLFKDMIAGLYIVDVSESSSSATSGENLYIVKSDAVQSTTIRFKYNKMIRDETVTKGNSLSTSVESTNRSEYPDNSYIGDHWYVYSHNYLYTFDNT